MAEYKLTDKAVDDLNGTLQKGYPIAKLKMGF